MTVLFVGSKLRDLLQSNMFEHTNALYADALYTQPPLMVVRAISQGGVHNSFIPLSGLALNDDIWLHMRLTTRNLTSFWSNGSGIIIQFYASDGDPVGELYTTNSAMGLRLYGDTTVVSLAGNRETFPNSNNIKTLDIKITVTASTLTLLWYVDGVLKDTITVANTTSAHGPIAGISLPFQSLYSTYDINTAPSEIIVTANESTVGWRLATLDPDAQGIFTQWIGDYTDGDFWQQAKSMKAAETGIRESWQVSDYLGPTSAVNIRGVYMSYVAEGGNGEGPQAIQPFTVLGGVAYDAAAQALTETPTRYMKEWAVNPATGAAWSPAALSNLEFGVRSA